MVNEGAVCERLDLDIVHFPYRDMAHHVRMINSYAQIAAEEKASKGAGFVVLHLVVNPIAKFVKTYVLQGGFLAGTRGFVHAWLASFSVFLKYAKLWESISGKTGGAQGRDTDDI